MDSARFYLKKSCLSGNLYSKTTGYLYLYKVEKKAGNHSAAYAYNDSFNIYRDSIIKIQQHQKIEELSTQYALAIQRKEIEAENRNIYYVITICLIVLLLGAFAVCQYLRREKKIRAQARKAELVGPNTDHQHLSKRKSRRRNPIARNGNKVQTRYSPKWHPDIPGIPVGKEFGNS